MASIMETLSPTGGAGALTTDTSGRPPPAKDGQRLEAGDVAVVFTDIWNSADAARRLGDLKMLGARQALD